jgi:inhibitor of KinA
MIGCDFMNFTIYPLGDSAVLIDFQIKDEEKCLHTITSLTHALTKYKCKYNAIIEAVPAYKTVTVHYNPLKIHSPSPFSMIKDIVASEIEALVLNHEPASQKVLTIPVLYGKEAGQDLPFVAEHNNLSEDRVIKIHSERIYTVAFLGFSPGFPFLRGMDSSIAAPRKKEPRIRIDAGSVGIAGNQTGIYPLSSPGGWQIIGQTPLKLFDPNNPSRPSLLSQGDNIRFSPITEIEFQRLEES